MLINSVRFYERILAGLQSDDEEVLGCAVGCLSYLVVHIRRPQQVLPAQVVVMLRRLPEVTR